MSENYTPEEEREGRMAEEILLNKGKLSNEKITDQSSPLPWKIGGIINRSGDSMRRIDDCNGIFIAEVSDKNLREGKLRDIDAELICLAVNTYKKTLKLLKTAQCPCVNERLCGWCKKRNAVISEAGL